MKKISIGIDFSKKTFDAAIACREGDACKQLGHAKFENDNSGYRAMAKWAAETAKRAGLGDRQEWIFCGENTGECSLGLCDFLYGKGLDVWLESALVIHRKCGIVRGKDDKADAQRIAEFALRNYEGGKTRLYQTDSEAYRRLRSLHAAHDMLTKDKVAKANQLKSGSLDHSKQAREAVEKVLQEIESQLKDIDRQIKEALSKEEEFKENAEILQSFAGAGPITASAFIVLTHNFKIMDSPKSLGCHAGVVPYSKKSGTTVDTPPKLSRYRDNWAKGVLTCCANSAIMFNPVIKEYYNRLISKGKNKNIAKNNCKNKIIHILLALVAKKQKFDPEWHAGHKAA